MYVYILSFLPSPPGVRTSPPQAGVLLHMPPPVGMKLRFRPRAQTPDSARLADCPLARPFRHTNRLDPLISQRPLLHCLPQHGGLKRSLTTWIFQQLRARWQRNACSPVPGPRKLHNHIGLAGSVHGQSEQTIGSELPATPGPATARRSRGSKGWPFGSLSRPPRWSPSRRAVPGRPPPCPCRTFARAGR